MEEYRLMEEAQRILPFAYAPYSGYRVAAALLTREGKIFKGVNVENASLGLTLCAEMVALAAAISSGYRHFSLLAVVSERGAAPFPCGACRQVISELAPEIKILVGRKGGSIRAFNLKELLPYPFELEKGENKDGHE